MYKLLEEKVKSKEII